MTERALPVSRSLSAKLFLATLLSLVCALAAYMVVYGVKNFFYNGMFIQGFSTAGQCWALVVSKVPATVVNGVLAIIFAPILGVALTKALHAAHLDRLMEKE